MATVLRALALRSATARLTSAANGRSAAAIRAAGRACSPCAAAIRTIRS
jgi:hypothetical protein